jgi:ferredoxin/flavodoxin---NADP+ reductase
MFAILSRQELNPTVVRISVRAPLIAQKAEPGQFVILRAGTESERIPLTIADYDRAAGAITLIFQLVGAGTMELGSLQVGERLQDLVGPLGKATETEGLHKVCVVGGGVGSAIAYPIAKKLHQQGAVVHSVVGFRTSDLIILENEFRAVSDELHLLTDDGSYGEKGLVTNALEALILAGNQYDEVIAIGPLVMMKFVSLTTKKYHVKTIVSMNPIMIDGTGMCGGCRLTVGGETKFACVDGPDFDGHLVDFDEALRRGEMYREFEQHARETACKLFPKEARQNAGA